MAMKISEVEGNLFDAPEGAVLVHACNCLGSWGGGIAKIFAQKYPAAYKVYVQHCKDLENNAPNTLIHSRTRKACSVQPPMGTTLLIPPQPEDYSLPGGKRHWIACLFTSYGFGKNLMPPDLILENTVHAVRDMARQLVELRAKDDDIAQIYSCRFNSGLFRVDWKDSKAVLEEEWSGVPEVGDVFVVRPKGEKE